MPEADKEVRLFMEGVRERTPHEEEFHQAVEGFARTVMPWYLDHGAYREVNLLERLTEPDRIVTFRVCWETDDGRVAVNRATRVQFNQSLGPYKGGLRFSPGVTVGVLKFLGFEQTFKNSLTGLPMGGAKGGADFDPKGRSEREVMRFCQSLMTELHRHIGEDVDVPAGDIGVGSREISFLFGQYLRLKNRWSGVLTGKGEAFGGSAGRTEATGYGCVCFADLALNHAGEGIEGKRVAISGSGNVAIYAAEKAIELSAKVVTISDSDGTARYDDGMTPEQLERLKRVKLAEGGRVAQLADDDDAVDYREGEKPWGVGCDVAMPCATQNELDADDAGRLIDGGVRLVCEGANMPLTADAEHRLREAGVLHAPGKAANAGGVAVSGLEQTQNAIRDSWPREKVNERLREIMRRIHDACVEHGERDGRVDYAAGANLAALSKVAEAMHAYGVV